MSLVRVNENATAVCKLCAIDSDGHRRELRCCERWPKITVKKLNRFSATSVQVTVVCVVSPCSVFALCGVGRKLREPANRGMFILTYVSFNCKYSHGTRAFRRARPRHRIARTRLT